MAIARAFPGNTASGVTTLPSRTGQDLSAYVLNLGTGNQIYGDEGSYFTCSNATLATGIAGHAAPVVADTDTKPLFFLFNGGTKNIIFDHLFLEVTAAGTGGTIQYTVVYTDNANATARTSGGTQITAINNSNTGSSIASGATVYFGAVVAAMTSSKKVGQQIAREVIPVVQDTVTMIFGRDAGLFHSGLTTAGTATNHLVQYFPPVVIAPGGNLNISQIRPSQSAAASYQFQAGWIER